MKYFKDVDNIVYAYESDGSQDSFIKSGLTPISEEEKDILLAPSEEQILYTKILEAKLFLTQTDWYYSRKMETGEEIPIDIVTQRLNSRTFLKNNGY